MTDTYTAEVRWEDGQWQASVRELPGAHTYAKTMTALGKRLREVIALMGDRPDSDVHDESAFSIQLKVSAPAQDKVAMDASDASVARAAEVAGAAGLVSVSHFGAGGRVITTERPDEALQQAAAARRRAAGAEAEAEHATTIAVLMAQRAGISMRDAAVLLGISHQRVQQIAAAAPVKAGAAS